MKKVWRAVIITAIISIILFFVFVVYTFPNHPQAISMCKLPVNLTLPKP